MIHSFLQLKTKLILITLISLGLFSCSAKSDKAAQNNGRSYNQYQPQQYIQQTPPRQDAYYYTQQPAYYGGTPYQYQQPASRYYANPYAVAPQNQYPYYDGDQYYVPPTYYGSSNRDNAPSTANQRF